MKKPYDGKVATRLVEKRFKGKIFYYLFDQQAGKGYTMGYGFLQFMNGGTDSIDHPMIRYFNSSGELTRCSQCSEWSGIFDRFEDAEIELKKIKSLYNDGFSNQPFIKLKMLSQIKDELIGIELAISKLWLGNASYKGVSFSDVSAGGIQVIACGCSVKLKYDLSNKVEVITKHIIASNDRFATLKCDLSNKVGVATKHTYCK